MRPSTNNRRRKTESITSDRRPPTPTLDPYPPFSTPLLRDSDASFTSSRPSLSSSRPSTIPSDRSHQLSTINTYLTSHSLPFNLKPPLPSAKDITETLKFLLTRLGFPPSNKLNPDELIHTIKFLKCPFKLNKSALSAPATPHFWPNLLSVIHWLVQIVKFNEFNENGSSSVGFENDKMFMYTVNSYDFYIRGDDEGMERLDEELVEEMRVWKGKVEESVVMVEDNVRVLEEKVKGMKTGLSQKQSVEKEKGMLEEDVEKFHIIIEQLDTQLVDLERKVGEVERELEVKVEDRKRICEENEELKRRVEEQGINSRDAERMKRELLALERDIEETEGSRNGWEEKIWEVDSEIGGKGKELERVMMECNQAIRRLKLGNGFQYQLNAKGSTPDEVIGSDYKTVLKPALISYAEDIKKSSIGKSEELVSLRQQSSENAAKLEEKRNHIATLQSYIDEVKAQLNMMRKETYEYTSKCAAEARKLAEEIELEENKMGVVEKEVSDVLKTSKADLQETTAQAEEQVKLCAHELFDLINTVSSYKENNGTQIARMRNDLFETAGAVSGIYKGYRPQKESSVPDASK